MTSLLILQDGGALLLQSGGGLALNVSEPDAIMSYPAPGFVQDRTIIDNRGAGIDINAPALSGGNPVIVSDPVSVW